MYCLSEQGLEAESQGCSKCNGEPAAQLQHQVPSLQAAGSNTKNSLQAFPLEGEKRGRNLQARKWSVKLKSSKRMHDVRLEGTMGRG